MQKFPKVSQKAAVNTNPKRGSVASCNTAGIVPVTFKELWDNYEKGHPYQVKGKTPDGFENQCAIRVSVTFHNVGVKMISFSQNKVKPEGNAPTIGRLVLNDMATATRANELAQWLNMRPICGVGPAINITGKDWVSKIKGKTGIVFFGEYWGDNSAGGHIDLWNGSKMTDGNSNFLRFTLGIDSLPGVYSDLGTAKRIWFFEVK